MPARRLNLIVLVLLPRLLSITMGRIIPMEGIKRIGGSNLGISIVIDCAVIETKKTLRRLIT